MGENNDKESEIGPVVGSIVIVIVLVIAALYVWGEHLNTVAKIEQENKAIINNSTTTTIIYSTSTVPSDIQKDLQATPPIQKLGF